MAALKENRQSDPRATVRAALVREHEERCRSQASALAQLDCLQGVLFEQLLRLAELGTLRAFVSGAVILNERTAGDFLYLVLRGTVSLTLHDRAGREVLVGVLDRGDCFGEGPLFGDWFRGATVQAVSSCYLLQLPLAEVRALLNEAPELALALKSIYRHRLVESTLGRVPLFGQLAPIERAGIAALLQPHYYQRGATIFHQGAPGDALYLIEAGQVAVEQGGQPIAYLDEGDFFGEMSLLTNEPHNADVRALTPVDVLALPAAEFMHLLDQQPELASQLRRVVDQRRAAGAAMRRDPARVHQLSEVVSHGLLRGTHVLVRDRELCVDGCRICEDACAARHGRARLRVDGVQLDGVDVVDTCRQCRVGAECVEACPSDAIQWNDRGALVITENCTGCGACVPACPYDAVQLVPRHPDPPSPLWSLWRRFKRKDTHAIPLELAPPSARADKCDLCAGYADLACVSACPSGALRLVPVEEVLPL